MKRSFSQLLRQPWLRSLCLAVLLPSFALAPGISFANPQGGKVIAGQAEITSALNQLTVNQGSSRAVIEWDSFSIAAGEITQFIQPGSSAAALNRVMGASPSLLQGMLKANGNVWLINPNGVVVGPGGMVDTGGFLASTLDVSNENFLRGGDIQLQGTSQAAVQNFGTINAASGDIFMVGRTVENHGVLGAFNGTVGLAGGNSVLIKSTGDQRVFVSAGEGSSVTNTGEIRSAVAELKAHGNAYALAVNNTGVVRATGIDQSGGRVMLRSNQGDIAAAGELSAANADGSGGGIEITTGMGEIQVGGILSAIGKGSRGGSVALAGSGIELMGGSSVDASGSDGGQIALSASRVEMRDGSAVKADGLTGRGGQVAVQAGDLVMYRNSTLGASGETQGGHAALSGSGTVRLDGGIFVDGGSGRGGNVGINGRDVSLGSDGVISASGATAGGLVSLTAADSGRLEGVIAADGAVGGNVELTANRLMEVGSEVTALGTAGAGGRISAVGREVALVSGADLAADGTTQGGTVNVGGSFQGRAEPGLRNSDRTRVDAGANLSADASAGNAGQVVVWSNGTTDFAGSASAQATGAVGRGGLIEVSGKEDLRFRGTVSARAVSGQSGAVLFDPGDLTIGGATSNIPIASLNPILQGGTSVIVATESGNISVQDLGLTDNRHGAIQWTSGASFGLFASENIFIDNHIRTSGSGSINILAGWTGSESDLLPGALPGVFGGVTPTVEQRWANYVNNGQFGNDGSVIIGRADLNRHVEVGSRYGNTNVAGSTLVMSTLQTFDGGESDWVMLGFRDSGSVFAPQLTSGGVAGTDMTADGTTGGYVDGTSILQDNQPATGIVGFMEQDRLDAAGNAGTDGVPDGVRLVNHTGAVGGTYVRYSNHYTNSRTGNWWWQRIEAANSAEKTWTLNPSESLGANRPEMGAGQSASNRADINVVLTGSLLMNAGGRHNNAVQIGHGGPNSNSRDDRSARNANVTIGGVSINSWSYNGSSSDRVSHSIARLAPIYGNINVLAGVNPSTVTYNQSTGTVTGTTTGAGGLIRLDAWQTLASTNRLTNPNLNLVNNSESYAQIGHLGAGQFGSVYGDIKVQAAGDIELLGGRHTRNHASIGHTMNGWAYWNPTDNPDSQIRFFQNTRDFDNPHLRYGELYSNGSGGLARGVYPATHDPISDAFGAGAGVYESDFTPFAQNGPIQVTALGGMTRKDIVGNIQVDSWGGNGLVMRSGSTPDLRDGQPDGVTDPTTGRSYVDDYNSATGLRLGDVGFAPDGIFTRATYDVGGVVLTGDTPVRDLNLDGFPDHADGFGSGAGDTTDPTRRVREGNSGADGIGASFDRRFTQIGHGGSGFGVDQVDGGEDFQLRVGLADSGTEELVRGLASAMNRRPTAVSLIGNINVNAHRGSVALTGGNHTYDFSMIGHGGNEVTELETSGVIAGDIAVTAFRDVTLEGSNIQVTAADDIHPRSQVQIGHGGYQHGFNYITGDVRVDAGRNVRLTAGPERDSYVQIGHGGSEAWGQIGGLINRNSDLSWFALGARQDIPVSQLVSGNNVAIMVNERTGTTRNNVVQNYAISGNTANVSVEAGGDLLMTHRPATDLSYSNRGGVGNLSGQPDFGGELLAARAGDRAQFSWTLIGHGGRNVDFFYATGDVGNPQFNFADIAGNIDVSTGGNLTMQNGDGAQFWTAIGHRASDAQDRQGNPRHVAYAGTIDVEALGNVFLDASFAATNDQNVGVSGFGNPAQQNSVAIGHGGTFDMFNIVVVDKDRNGSALATVNGMVMDSDIRVAAGGDVTLQGGRGYRASHAQIGHGYPSDAGNDQAFMNNAVRPADGGPNPFTGTMLNVGFNGDITVESGRDVNVLAGNNPWVRRPADAIVENTYDAFAVIGHGGAMMDAAASGNISVSAVRNLLIQGMQRTDAGVDPTMSRPDGPVNNMARVGHFATEYRINDGNRDVNNVIQNGNISVVVGNDLTLRGGRTTDATNRPVQLATAQIGLGGAGTNGGFTGNIDLRVGRDLITQDGSTGGTLTKNNYVMVGNGDWLKNGSDTRTANGNATGTRSGDIRIATGRHATLDNTLIGHASSILGTLIAAGSDTYLAVSRNQPNFNLPGSTGVLTTNAGTIFSSGGYGVDGDLRLYMPNRPNNAIGVGTFLNGFAYSDPDATNPPAVGTGVSLAAGDARPDETLNVFEHTFTYDAEGLPQGTFTPQGTYTIVNGIGGFYALYYNNLAPRPIVPPTPPPGPIEPPIIEPPVVPEEPPLLFRAPLTLDIFERQDENVDGSTFNFNSWRQPFPTYGASPFQVGYLGGLGGGNAVVINLDGNVVPAPINLDVNATGEEPSGSSVPTLPVEPQRRPGSDPGGFGTSTEGSGVQTAPAMGDDPFGAPPATPPATPPAMEDPFGAPATPPATPPAMEDPFGAPATPPATPPAMEGNPS